MLINTVETKNACCCCVHSAVCKHKEIKEKLESLFIDKISAELNKQFQEKIDQTLFDIRLDCKFFSSYYYSLSSTSMGNIRLCSDNVSHIDSSGIANTQDVKITCCDNQDIPKDYCNLGTTACSGNIAFDNNESAISSAVLENIPVMTDEELADMLKTIDEKFQEIGKEE